MNFTTDIAPKPVLDSFVERAWKVRGIRNELGIFVVSRGLELQRNDVERLTRGRTISDDGITAILEGLLGVRHIMVDQGGGSTVTAYGPEANEGVWASVTVMQTGDVYEDLETVIHTPGEDSLIQKRWYRPWETRPQRLGGEDTIGVDDRLYPAIVLANGMKDLLIDVSRKHSSAYPVT